MGCDDRTEKVVKFYDATANAESVDCRNAASRLAIETKRNEHGAASRRERENSCVQRHALLASKVCIPTVYLTVLYFPRGSAIDFTPDYASILPTRLPTKVAPLRNYTSVTLCVGIY